MKENAPPRASTSAARIGRAEEEALQSNASIPSAPPPAQVNSAQLSRITESSSNVIPVDFDPDPDWEEHCRIHGLERPCRFRPVILDEVKPREGPRWLVDGLLPARGLACIVGQPKSGKSYLTMDMLIAPARGMSYVGRETRQATVLYCTGEGVQGFEDRLIAMRQHLGIEGDDVPFYMLNDVPDLGSESADLDQFLSDIDQAFQFADPPGVIVFDTLARSMGEGDENSARDMGRFVRRRDAIAKHFDCLVVVIHHIGKDASRGARGSKALTAAADVVIEVTKNEMVNIARVTDAKDAPEGLEWRFCIVPCANNANKKRSAPSGVAGDLFKIVRHAIEEVGTIKPNSIRVPANTRAVSAMISKDTATQWVGSMGPIRSHDAGNFRSIFRASAPST